MEQLEESTGILVASPTLSHSWPAVVPGQILTGMLGRRGPCTEGQCRELLEQGEQEHCQASPGRECRGRWLAKLLLLGETHEGDQQSLVDQVSQVLVMMMADLERRMICYWLV